MIAVWPSVRRWCETCYRFTGSVMFSSYEACAEHEDADHDDEEEDDW